MNNSLVRLLFFMAIAIIPIETFAQMAVVEKSYDISRKSKKGYLGDVEVNNEAQTFNMIYVLPSSDKKVKTETYTFDKDLTLTNTVNDEWDLEKMRSKFSWFNYKGDVYYTNTLSASSTMGGKLVFRKKLITSRYRWWYGTYAKNVKMLEKVKPTSEAEEKYVFRGGAYEVERDSSVLVIAGRQDVKNDINSYKNYDLIKADNNVNIKVMESISFPGAYIPIFAEPLQDDNTLSNDDLPRDWIVVFAPFGGKAYSKIQVPDPTKLIYFRISPEGKIIERAEISSPSNGWRILTAYEREGSIYFYGPSITDDVKTKYINQIYTLGLVATTSADAEEKEAENAKSTGFGGAFKSMGSAFSGGTDIGQTQDAIDAMIDEMKFNGFVLGKMTNGKFDFIKETPVGEFDSKAVKPAGQKDIVEFDGKRFKTFNIYLASNGDILINGQIFKISKAKPFGADNNVGAHLYTGVYMFQFDSKGTLKHNYGVEMGDQKDRAGFFNRSPLTADMFPASSYLTESVDKSKLYWNMNICRAVHEEESYDYSFFSASATKTWEPLFSVMYGTLDLANGVASDFKVLGDAEKKDFYLFPSNNVVNMGQYLIYLTEPEKGDKLLLSRMDISK